MARKKAVALLWVLTLLIVPGNPARDRASRILSESAGTMAHRRHRHSGLHAEDRMRLQAQTHDAQRLPSKAANPQTQVEGEKQ